MRQEQGEERFQGAHQALATEDEHRRAAMAGPSPGFRVSNAPACGSPHLALPGQRPAAASFTPKRHRQPLPPMDVGAADSWIPSSRPHSVEQENRSLKEQTFCGVLSLGHHGQGGFCSSAVSDASPT